MLTITRRLEFDYGHRVLGHEGKCKHLHGHRGVAEITVTAPELDTLGRVIDFSVIKTEVGGWIDRMWDHNMILNTKDPLWAILYYPDQFQDKKTNEERFFNNKLPFALVNQNPTAEVMARTLYDAAKELLSAYGITIVSVRLYETPNSYADYSEDSK